MMIFVGEMGISLVSSKRPVACFWPHFVFNINNVITHIFLYFLSVLVSVLVSVSVMAVGWVAELVFVFLRS